MKKRKVGPSQYFVCYNNKLYEVYKRTLPDGKIDWCTYRGVDRKEFMICKKTLKECLEFIELNYTPMNLLNVKQIPKQHIDQKYRNKRSGKIWSIDDIIYSTADGRWKIDAYYYVNSFDEGRYTFDVDDFEMIFEEVEN